MKILSEMKEDLDNLTDELFDLLSDEDLDEEKLEEASENLLPRLADTLNHCGFGTTARKERADQINRPQE